MGKGSVVAQEPGTEIVIKESGENESFIVLSQNYQNTGYALVRRKYPYPADTIRLTTMSLAIANTPTSLDISNLTRSLDSYFDVLDPVISSYIPEIEVVYNRVKGKSGGPIEQNGNVSNPRKIFILSAPEIGYQEYRDDDSFSDGELIPYFSDPENRKFYNIDGSQIQYYLRTMCGHKMWTDNVYGIYMFYKNSITYEPLNGDYRRHIVPIFCLPSTLYVDDNGYVVENTPPEITGTDGDIGTFGETSPTYAYTVTDPQGGTVSVTEALDGVTLRTYNVTLGQQNTLTIPAATYLTTLNGTHTLTITATDSVGASTVRTETFTKNVTSCAFTQTTAFTADDMPTRCVINIQGAFPSGSTLTVQVCNNGNDPSPTWETITQQALLGQKYFFTNQTKTAAEWGVKVQASLSRGTAEGDCYISSIGGVFQ